MTPEEIRAEAIERIARALIVEHMGPGGGMAWDAPGDRGRTAWIAKAAAALEALGDLLPTQVAAQASPSGAWKRVDQLSLLNENQRRQIETLRDERDKRQKSAAMLEREAQRYRDKTDRLTGELEAALADKRNWRMATDDLDKQVEALRGERDKWHKASLSLEADLEALGGELAAQKVQMTGELTRLEGELAEAKAGARWMHGRWAKDVEPKPLPDRMRIAADVLEEAHRHCNVPSPKQALTNAATLRKNADRFEVEDRERAETEQRVEEVAQLLHRSQADGHGHWDGIEGYERDGYRDDARALLAYYTMTPKAVGE